jgi:hypothetical protein
MKQAGQIVGRVLIGLAVLAVLMGIVFGFKWVVTQPWAVPFGTGLAVALVLGLAVLFVLWMAYSIGALIVDVWRGE